jgi:hypothetical protein
MGLERGFPLPLPRKSRRRWPVGRLPQLLRHGGTGGGPSKIGRRLDGNTTAKQEASAAALVVCSALRKIIPTSFLFVASP